MTCAECTLVPPVQSGIGEGKVTVSSNVSSVTCFTALQGPWVAACV